MLLNKAKRYAGYISALAVVSAAATHASAHGSRTLSHGLEVVYVNDLYLAAANGSAYDVRILLRSGSKINAQDDNGFTALHLAAANGHVDVVALLLKESANSKVQDKHGCTALHLAAANGCVSVIRALAREENADVRNNNGFTALHLAAANGYTDAIVPLLEAGANVNVQEGYGYTALHFAAAYGHKNTTRVLLEGGADINAREGCGYTALCLADVNRQSAIYKLLKEGTSTGTLQDRQKRVTPHPVITNARLKHPLIRGQLQDVKTVFDSDENEAFSLGFELGCITTVLILLRLWARLS